MTVVFKEYHRTDLQHSDCRSKIPTAPVRFTPFYHRLEAGIKQDLLRSEKLDMDTTAQQSHPDFPHQRQPFTQLRRGNNRS